MPNKVYIVIETPNDYESDSSILDVFDSEKKAQELVDAMKPYATKPYWNIYSIEEYDVK